MRGAGRARGRQRRDRLRGHETRKLEYLVADALPQGCELGVFSDTEGMVTDPVHEGRSMAATIDLVGRGEIDPSSTVLHAHLGGQPALNGCSALFS